MTDEQQTLPLAEGQHTHSPPDGHARVGAAEMPLPPGSAAIPPPGMDPGAMLVWQAQQIQEHAAKLAETVQRVTGLEQGYVTMSGWVEREAGKTARLETDVGALQTNLQMMVKTTQEMHTIVVDVQHTLSDWAPRGIKIDALLEETATVAERQEWAVQEAEARNAEAEARRKALGRNLALVATTLGIIGSLTALVTTAGAWGPGLHTLSGYLAAHQLASMVMAASVVFMAGALWIWWMVGAQNRAARAGTMARRRDDRPLPPAARPRA